MLGLGYVWVSEVLERPHRLSDTEKVTILNAHYAFKTACIGAPELAKELLSDPQVTCGKAMANRL